MQFIADSFDMAHLPIWYMGSVPADIRALLADARDALQASLETAEHARQRYDALFDAVPDPVSIIDHDGFVLDLTKAGIAAYRRSRGEIIRSLNEMGYTLRDIRDIFADRLRTSA